MKRFIALICMVAVIPIAGILVATYVKHHFDGEFEEAVSRHYGEKGIEALKSGRASFSLYCNSADGIDEPACTTYSLVGALHGASILAIAVGFGLLLAIYLAARMASVDRRILLAVFAPGIKVVLIVLFGLILIQGAIATYGAYVLEATAVHRVHFILIAGIGVGALAGSIAMISAGFSISQRASTVVLGMPATEKAEPELWRFVRDIGTRLGASPPGTIVIGLEPNFYVTSADVDVHPSRYSARNETLYLSLSLPLMRLLSHAELSAVVGHELGHFRGEDTQYSLKFYPIYAGTVHALAALQESAGSVTQSLALLPAFAVLSFFVDQFARAENTLGRDRELEADKAGASVSSPRSLGTSLLKIGAFAPLWRSTIIELAHSIEDGRALPNAGAHYVASAMASAKPELLADVSAFTAAHPTDTHPPTGVRIQALGLSVEELQAEALTVSAEHSSAKLLSNAAQLEEALTVIQRKALVDLGVREGLRPVRPVSVDVPQEEVRPST